MVKGLESLRAVLFGCTAKGVGGREHMNLITELNETIKLLESEIPANPSRNEKLEDRLRGSLAEYFHNLEQAIDISELERIYYRNIREGGQGSGNFGHAGRPGEVGGSGEGGVVDPVRSERARNSYNRADATKQRIADRTEVEVADELGGKRIGDNQPFDVVVGGTGIEVKTIVDAKVGKITMRRECRLRKLDEARKAGLTKVVTVVKDVRGASPQYYYKEGVGSFRLSGMTPVSSLAELKGVV